MKVNKLKWYSQFEEYPLHVAGGYQGAKKVRPISVMGQRIEVEGLDNFKFFIHEAVDGPAFVVSELETGMVVHHGAWSDSKDDVVRDARKILINRFSDGTLQAALSKGKQRIEKNPDVLFPINEITEL